MKYRSKSNVLLRKGKVVASFLFWTAPACPGPATTERQDTEQHELLLWGGKWKAWKLGGFDAVTLHLVDAGHVARLPPPPHTHHKQISDQSLLWKGKNVRRETEPRRMCSSTTPTLGTDDNPPNGHQSRNEGTQKRSSLHEKWLNRLHASQC